MGCASCQGGKQKMGICDVHLLVDDDDRERLVKWCAVCQAYICDECKLNLIKRAQAAIIRARNGNNNRNSQ